VYDLFPDAEELPAGNLACIDKERKCVIYSEDVDYNTFD
jgi:hypothetical protein